MGDLRAARSSLEARIGDRMRADYPMAPLTSFRIGGPAALFVEPHSEEDLQVVADAVRVSGVPVLVIGKGSNLLIADEGFPGIVIRLGRPFRWAARDGDHISAGAAMPLPALAGVAASHALSGLEFGVAIPASLGGSVRMNAGAHGHSLDEVVEAVELFSLPEGVIRTLTAEEAGFSYRGSSLPGGAVVVAARMALSRGDPSEIRALMDEARRWRRETQPLAEPNCGSVFKNPEGDHAARLVEAAEAKGMREGGARVSEKHANFIVAEQGSSARDVRTLIERIRERVKDRFGVWLETEVHMVGSFEPGPADVA